MVEETNAVSEMNNLLAAQKAAHLKDGIPTAERRIDWIDRTISALITNKDRLADAMSEDFGHRSRDQSMVTDISASIESLKHSKKHVRKWMKADKRKPISPLGWFGAKARVEYQPKGVVGVVSPWNFPVNLTFVPLANIFAAGNRCMIKPSEYTPVTSEVMKEILSRTFDPTEVAVVTGGPEEGAAFTKLAFDHLLFTGATSIAYHVMRSAAENLVPLTLELGGKSPVVIGQSADMKKTAARVMAGKTLNAGQICLAPDYVFAPEDRLEEFVGEAKNAVAKMYPTLKENDDYTSVVNQRHFDRLQGYLEDAKSKGAQIVEINPADEHFSQQPHHKIPPTLILNPTDDMTVMQDEIFGPLLPVKTYKSTSEAVDYVNGHDRPLAVYYFGEDSSERDFVVNGTTSGGVTVNDVLFHNAAEDLPFGGIGPSGMGAYHGHDGFLEFSHKKAVYTQTKSEILAMMRPPYGEALRKQIAGRLKP